MTPTTPNMTSRRALTAIGNETVKGLRQGWNERLQILIEMPLFIAFMLLLAFTIGEGDAIVDDQLDWTLTTAGASWLIIGLCAFIYAYLHVQKMFWRLLAEIQTGTLEQVYISPLPSWVNVVIGRIVSAIAETAIVVAIVYGATNLFVSIDLHWRAEALLFLMFFSGALMPLTDLPDWAGAIGKPLFLTHSVDALRVIMFEGGTVTWGGTGGWVWTLASALGWLAAGLIAFKLFERIAKRQGSLSQF